MAPVFELKVGRTEQTNKLSTFRLETEGRSAHIRLGRNMDYESIAEYTLTIRIQVMETCAVNNKFKLDAKGTLSVKLIFANIFVRPLLPENSSIAAIMRRLYVCTQ